MLPLDINYNNKIIDRVEKKYGARDWEQFDKIQEQQRQILSDDDSKAKKIQKKKPTKK